MLPEQPPERHIVIDGVSVSYPLADRQVEALDRVSFDVKRNEFVCIMGRSGCGKTTLLNVIGGFVKASAGHVAVGGRVVSKPGADRAVVFQSDAVFPWMTVRDNISFGLRLRHEPQSVIEETTQRYARLVDLVDFLNAWPRQLSDGMKKRVDVARGYAADPEVLLLDEPFGALDLMTKNHLQDELLKLAAVSPRTTIFVTHDVEEAIYLADRVVVLSPRPGRLLGIWPIPLPKPRPEGIRVREDFLALRAQISGAVSQENPAGLEVAHAAE
jgi:NitT/TauT family transport system ATP-binding protein